MNRLFVLYTNKIEIETPPSLKRTDGADSGQRSEEYLCGIPVVSHTNAIDPVS